MSKIVELDIGFVSTERFINVTLSNKIDVWQCIFILSLALYADAHIVYDNI